MRARHRVSILLAALFLFALPFSVNAEEVPAADAAGAAESEAPPAEESESSEAAPSEPAESAVNEEAPIESPEGAPSEPEPNEELPPESDPAVEDASDNGEGESAPGAPSTPEASESSAPQSLPPEITGPGSGGGGGTVVIEQVEPSEATELDSSMAGDIAQIRLLMEFLICLIPVGVASIGVYLFTRWFTRTFIRRFC